MAPNFETAYAKINLALHVQTRRDDGYHDLESLVAFLDYGDFLEIEPAQTDSLTVEGEFAALIGDSSDNLVMQALRWARDRDNPDIPPLAIRLSKYLPVAAGLGGGSADAAALLRLLANLGHLHHSLNELRPETASLGADIPACLLSMPLIMRGIGEQIEVVGDDSLYNIFAVLINPGVPVPTGSVFNTWDRIDHGGLPDGTALEIALRGRNDLQAPAIALCPVIGDVIAVLQATNPILARMSGSGATCFALYDDPQKAGWVAGSISRGQPDWWVRAGNLTQWR